MPKILQINSGITRSTGSIAQAIGELVITNQWESWIMYSARNEKTYSKSNLYRIGSSVTAKLHAIMTRCFDMHGLGSYWATKKLVAGIAKINPDVVHLHNIHGYYINYPVLFSYLIKSNTPIVWTFHDCWSMTGHCAHFDAIGCDRWRTGCFKCPLKTDYPSSIIFDRSIDNWNLKKKCFTSVSKLTIVPVSSWLESIVKSSFLSNYQTRVIHNGVDLETFKPGGDNVIRNRYSLSNKIMILGVATGWFEGGGIRRFNEFIKLSSLLNDDYRIILIGLEEKQISELPKNVIGLQRTTNQQELAKFYSAADVFVNPTYQDSLPTVNIESLACGTPVITYKTGGSPEIISEKTGWIVEKGDIEAIFKIIRELQSVSIHDKQTQRINCRKRAEAYFNKEDRFQDYIELYKQIVNGTGN